MATPRHLLVDPEHAHCYHIVSRCVRRSWLCGLDRRTGRDYSHRKQWLLERLRRLGSSFSVDVYAYTIMSNHFHLVVHYHPLAATEWTDDEVVDRWLRVCPVRSSDGTVDAEFQETVRATILNDQGRIESLRGKLCSLSVFMQLLKQPIARRANLEDRCSGHFFEQRFYSCALLDERSVLAAMAYVDLNPIRARIAKSIADSEHTSIHARLQEPEYQAKLEDYLEPLIVGAKLEPPVKITLSEYADCIEALAFNRETRFGAAKLSRWRSRIATVQRKPRAIGAFEILKKWHAQRRWKTPRWLIAAE
jgi:hypothetical protein